MADNPLGKQVTYPTHYDASLLLGIPRSQNRAALGLEAGELPFQGFDLWHAWELSWLDMQGLPQVAIGRFIFPCTSPNLVESKSLKLYLNSLNQERYADRESVCALISRDLSACAGAEVLVEMSALHERNFAVQDLQGSCLDTLAVDISAYDDCKAELLQLEAGAGQVSETLYTDLFRSNCPITNQPDWASMVIIYRGQQIAHSALLAYLVSYRQHNDFHENCVERIYCDLMQYCQPQELTVRAHFLRRGGLDINPLRSSLPAPQHHDFMRLQRQ